MQDMPLNISQLLEYGAATFPNATITSFATPSADALLDLSFHSISELHQASQPGHALSINEADDALNDAGNPAANNTSAAAPASDATAQAENPELTGHSCTFAELRARCAAIAHVLEDKFQVEADSWVATFLKNQIEHLEIFFATTGKGAIFQPINTHISVAQVRAILKSSQAQVLISSPEHASVLAQILQESNFGIRALIFLGPQGSPVFAQAQELLGDRVECWSLEQLLDGSSSIYHWPVIPEQNTAAICYTASTTGAPKAVAYSHRSIYLQCLQLSSSNALRLTADETVLCGVPLFLALGWFVPITAWLTGCNIVLPGTLYNPAHVAGIIAQTQPQKAVGAPSSWISLVRYYLQHPPAHMPLEEIFAGGSSVPPALIDIWGKRFNTNVIQVWTMTELSGIGTLMRLPSQNPDRLSEDYRHFQGRFLPLIHRRIISGDAEVSNTEFTSGEIQVRGHTVTSAYLPDQDSTSTPTSSTPARSFTIDGWLRTQDIGVVNNLNFLRLHDRAEDVIHSGGESIYTNELELQLIGSPIVRECMVIGIPDKTWGQRPLALIVLQPNFPATLETAFEIHTYGAEFFPGWMLPDYWTFVSEIPKTAVGAFNKQQARALLNQGAFEILHTALADSQQATATSDAANADSATPPTTPPA